MAAEPTLKDVMSMLNSINEKISERPAASSPALSPVIVPRKASDIPPCPLNGCWASKEVIDRVLYTKDAIVDRAQELAKQISKDYPDATEDNFVVVGLMNGVYMFMADLTRNLEIPHQVDFLAISSYGLETVSSANIKIKKDLDMPVAGKDVLILDEMCDTGNSMACVKELFRERGARSVKVCVLLDKVERRTSEVELDYVGWTCPDEFLVGYGMDWSYRFRSLPYIGVVKRSAYAKD